MSFISTEQACTNAEEEIPDFDFDGTAAASRAAWNDVLKRVQVGTNNVDDETVVLLYSSVSVLVHLRSVHRLNRVYSCTGRTYLQQIVRLYQPEWLHLPK